MNWPFPVVNGERTPESKALMDKPPEKPLTVYEQCLLTEPDDALI